MIHELENRSFDSILGSLSLGNPLSKINGLNGSEYNLLKGTRKINMTRATVPISYFDPGHSVEAIHQQIYGSDHQTIPTMSGFVDNAYATAPRRHIEKEIAISEVMTYFTEEHLPVTYALAKEFAIIEDWFGMTFIPKCLIRKLLFPVQPTQIAILCTALQRVEEPLISSTLLDFPSKRFMTLSTKQKNHGESTAPRYFIPPRFKY